MKKTQAHQNNYYLYNKLTRLLIVLGLAISSLAGCGQYRNLPNELPGPEQTSPGEDSAQGEEPDLPSDHVGAEPDLPTSDGDLPPPSDPIEEPRTPVRTITLSSSMEIRKLEGQVLEKITLLPAGSVIEILAETQNNAMDYRDDSGRVQRSSNGFLHPIRLGRVPNLSDSAIADLNAQTGGLYISARIEKDQQGTQGNFSPLSLGSAGPGFLKLFSSVGKPLNAYTSGINKRFPGKINQPVRSSDLSEADRVKYERIYQELVRVSNRAVATPKSLLMMPLAEARQHSINYENTGVVHPIGAWTIAVEGTAVRHDFANVPCAEFMSEVVRQAYQRAGYSVHDDFNTKKGNQLIWHKTASVVGLSQALVNAGWVPWDPQVFRPPTGALLFHMTGKSPGHTYISAGLDGQLIVDNGSPQGRNLRQSTEKTISLMFRTGLFILPPGIQPERW